MYNHHEVAMHGLTGPEISAIYSSINSTDHLMRYEKEKGNIFMSLAFFIRTDEGYILTSESRVGAIVNYMYTPKNENAKKIILIGSKVGVVCVGEQKINNDKWYNYIELLHNNSSSNLEFLSKIKALVRSLAQCNQNTQFLIIFSGDRSGIYSNSYDSNVYFFDETQNYLIQGDSYYLDPHMFLNYQIGLCKTISDGLDVVQDLQKRAYETAVYLENTHRVPRTINNVWKTLVLPFNDNGYFV